MTDDPRTPRQLRAQLALIHEREAYWDRKANGVRGPRWSAAKTEDLHIYDRVANRQDGRSGGRYVGMIWSQRHKPAQPSDVLLRALRAKEKTNG